MPGSTSKSCAPINFITACLPKLAATSSAKLKLDGFISTKESAGELHAQARTLARATKEGLSVRGGEPRTDSHILPDCESQRLSASPGVQLNLGAAESTE